jgi:hypothetical protein
MNRTLCDKCGKKVEMSYDGIPMDYSDYAFWTWLGPHKCEGVKK